MALGAALLLSPALANDTAAHCRDYVAQHGDDDSGCDCLGEAAAKDQALADALAAIQTPEDLEAAPDTAKAAIQACFPNSDV
jgi:hypothetical protein